MIHVGLAGWGDHDELYAHRKAGRDKLKEYSRHFSCVEVDSSFYAILSEETYTRWVNDTPDGFSFIIKAYQGLTGHQRGRRKPSADENDFAAFCSSLRPVAESGKLRAVLFQYPPWFDCKREHVELLRKARRAMADLPLALEFRHQSWFAGEMKARTLGFMEREGWIHSICDEPQAGDGSVPTVLHPTDACMTLVRMHGRNTEGWNSSGDANWREVRYLYRYSEEELLDWKERLQELESRAQHVYVIFNNNSGGHAAGNAKQLEMLLGKQTRSLAPKQIEFDIEW